MHYPPSPALRHIFAPIRPRFALARALSPALRRGAAGLTAALLVLAPGSGTGLHAETPLAVVFVTAHTAPVTLHFELSGTIEAAEAANVGFRSGGRIVSVAVQVGERVRKGQLLAEIDPTQARAAERAAQAQFAAAEVVLTQASQARGRAAELTQRGAATQAALDGAIEAELSAQSSRDAALAQLGKARQAVADTALHSPSDGIVTGREGEPGQIVGAAQTVLTIARDGPREAVFYVPDLPELDRFRGQKVSLRPVEGNAPAFGATVTEIAPLVAGASGSVRVKARLDADAASPGLGTAVISRLDLPYGSAMALPWSVLVSDGRGAAVWTVDPESQRVALAPVRVLRYSDTGLEIAQGLAEGAVVVASGAHLLYPGRKVAPVGASQ